MSWESGVDLVGCTQSDLILPNVIVHVAQHVHTPVGSAAAGLVAYQPDPGAPPILFGFVSPEPDRVGCYFGPSIFGGTPFASAPTLLANIEIETASDHATAVVQVAGHELRARLEQLTQPTVISREPGVLPFWQQGVGSLAMLSRFWFDGVEIPLFRPSIRMSGSSDSVYFPCGLYCR